MKKLTFVFVLLLLAFSALAEENGKSLLVRCDDIGMCHAVNVAAQELAETGILLNYSLMFACPWYQEAVDILKDYDNVCFGVHLMINSEWENYRWGPCATSADVSSLVDEDGFFFPRKALTYAANPKLEHIEIELRAQLDRAMNSGLDISYCDWHMTTLNTKPEYRQLVNRLATEYGLIVSEFASDYRLGGMYSQAPKEKKKAILDQIAAMGEGQTAMMVCHLGKQSPEMDALKDMNPSGPKNMSEHREAEFKVLSSRAFRKALEKHEISLTTHEIEYSK